LVDERYIAAAGGGAGLRRSIENARHAVEALDAAYLLVPREWWLRSEIDPRHISEVLGTRLERLPELLNVNGWGDFDYDQNRIPIIQL